MYCMAKGKELFTSTLGDTQDDSWANGGFDLVARSEGLEWRGKYWKRWDASKKAAIRSGYRFQRVKIVPIANDALSCTRDEARRKV